MGHAVSYFEEDDRPIKRITLTSKSCTFYITKWMDGYIRMSDLQTINGMYNTPQVIDKHELRKFSDALVKLLDQD